MKRFFMACMALIAMGMVVAPVIAAPAAPSNPKKVLTKATVDKFIKDFPLMVRELEALGADYEETFMGSDGEDEEMDEENPFAFDPDALRKGFEAAMADKRVKAVFDKYKWSAGFADDFSAVLACYVYASFVAQAQFFPPEQLAAMIDPIAPYVNKSDLALVKAQLPALAEMFESLE